MCVLEARQTCWMYFTPTENMQSWMNCALFSSMFAGQQPSSSLPLLVRYCALPPPTGKHWSGVKRLHVRAHYKQNWDRLVKTLLHSAAFVQNLPTVPWNHYQYWKYCLFLSLFIELHSKIMKQRKRDVAWLQWVQGKWQRFTTVKCLLRSCVIYGLMGVCCQPCSPHQLLPVPPLFLHHVTTCQQVKSSLTAPLLCSLDWRVEAGLTFTLLAFSWVTAQFVIGHVTLLWGCVVFTALTVCGFVCFPECWNLLQRRHQRQRTADKQRQNGCRANTNELITLFWCSRGPLFFRLSCSCV